MGSGGSNAYCLICKLDEQWPESGGEKTPGLGRNLLVSNTKQLVRSISGFLDRKPRNPNGLEGNSHAHVFEIDLPGFTKEDVKIEVHEGTVLQMSTAQRKEEAEEKGDKWHCKERPRGGFSRRFRLPENAKIDEIKASMHDGVLVVTVPKDELKTKPKSKAVKFLEMMTLLSGGYEFGELGGRDVLPELIRRPKPQVSYSPAQAPFSSGLSSFSGTEYVSLT
ncbi:17.5 kd heat shock family protein [Salix suchowensis]|nr:17.5 kd heat shock family protein [Salix suchowensis]